MCVDAFFFFFFFFFLVRLLLVVLVVQLFSFPPPCSLLAPSLLPLCLLPFTSDSTMNRVHTLRDVLGVTCAYVVHFFLFFFVMI